MMFVDAAITGLPSPVFGANTVGAVTGERNIWRRTNSQRKELNNIGNGK